MKYMSILPASSVKGICVSSSGCHPPLVIDSQRDFRLAQTQDLLTAIRTGGDTRTPLREGARTLDLVLAAARSGETHAEVRL